MLAEKVKKGKKENLNIPKSKNNCIFVIMPRTKSHIRNVKHILLMWFVLFSLSPCTVKEIVFNSVNVDYAKPLNKSKTAAQTSSCQYSSNDSRPISIAEKSNLNKQTEPVDFYNNPHFEVRSTKVHNNYSKTSSGNSPPKYILYKRLKIDIA